MSAGAGLRTALARLRDLLVRAGDRHWAETVSNALETPDDAALAGIVQSWFAEMNGLNTLVLSPASGHPVPSCAINATNRAFVALRSELFRLSRATATP